VSTFEFIDAEESWRIFEAAAQREFGMNAVEFIARWDAHMFDDNPTASFVAALRPVLS
jgi:hypothetical protein